MRKRKKKNVVIDRAKYIESVYHIVYYGNLIDGIWKTFRSIAENISDEDALNVRLSVQWHVLIIANSLMDELNNYLFKYNLADANEENKILRFKHIIEPILVEMNSWHDLRNFRNRVLAHNFRNKELNFKSVLLNGELHQYVIPNQIHELIAIFKYLSSISKIASQLFVDEYNEATRIVESLEINEKEKMPLTGEIFEKVDAILFDVNRRISEYST